jgi:hypothetical protein
MLKICLKLAASWSCNHILASVGMNDETNGHLYYSLRVLKALFFHITRSSDNNRKHEEN